MFGSSLNRVNGATWFPMLYHSDGTATVTAKPREYIPSCTLFKVCIGRYGFVCVPLSDPCDRYFIGWRRDPMVAGVEVDVRVGGLAGPVSLPDSHDGDWCAISDGKVFYHDGGSVSPSGSFGCVCGENGIMLFPFMIGGLR